MGVENLVYIKIYNGEVENSCGKLKGLTSNDVRIFGKKMRLRPLLCVRVLNMGCRFIPYRVSISEGQLKQSLWFCKQSLFNVLACSVFDHGGGFEST